MEFTPNTIQKSGKYTISRKRYHGFTLVELIVVITILVILGTIAFTSLSGFSGSARDSSRLSDITNIAKGLDITLAKVGSYPTPDNSFNVTYSGGNVWHQGVVGDAVIRTISAGGGITISKKPLDPLKVSQEYVYSKLAYGNAYQLRADWEGDSVSRAKIYPIEQAEAATGNPTITYVKGNYNGVSAKTQTGNFIYLLAIPSIVSGTGSVGQVLKIENNELSGALMMHGSSNTAGVAFNPKVVYSSGALPSTIAEKTLFASGLAMAYSGTPLAVNKQIQPIIMAVATNDVATLGNFGGGIVSASLGGASSGSVPVQVVATSTKFPGEDGVSGNGDDCDTDNITLGNGQVWSACNLGATLALSGANGGSYNANGSSIRGGNDSVNGKFYQWGRNKGFSSSDTLTGAILTSNPNGADTYNFVWSPGSSRGDWLQTQTDNLWGGVVADTQTLDAQTDKTLRRGACPSGWHVPSPKEWQDACNAIEGTTCTSNMSDLGVMRIALKLPMTGKRDINLSGFWDAGVGYYWASSPMGNQAWNFNFGSSSVYYTAAGNYRATAMAVRCLKN